MSPLRITRPSLLAAAAAVLALAACGSPRSPLLYDQDTGHPGGWLTDHPAAFVALPDQCRECHGDDLTGGNSLVSCFAASFEGSGCHAGGPGSAGHGPGWVAAHGAAYRADPGSCAGCHGADLRGGTSGVSCYAASWNGVSCHAGGPGTGAHGPGWVVSAHVAAALADLGSCRSCHGVDLAGGTSGVACASCHLESWQKVHILSWYPNVAGNHRGWTASHGSSRCANQWCHGTSLQGVPGSGPACATCHGDD